MKFDGYSKDGLTLLSELPRLSKARFQENKARWDALLYQPSLALIATLGEILHREISPDIQAVPKTNGSLSPIHRDLRFAKDKAALYKDHLLLNFWEGEPKKHAPTLRVRIASDSIGFAAGAKFSAEGLRSWRKSLDTTVTGETFQKLLDSHIAKHDSNLADPALKKPPSPWTLEHPRAELLRHKAIQIRFQRATPNHVNSSEFAVWCAEQLCSFKGIHQWLTSNINQ